MDPLKIVLRSLSETRLISSLAVKGDARMNEGKSSLQRSISTAASSLLSPYSVLIHLNNLCARFTFAFYLTPDDHISNYF